MSHLNFARKNRSKSTSSKGKVFVPSERESIKKSKNVADEELDNLFATFDRLETSLKQGFRDSIEIDTSIFNPVYAIDAELDLLTDSSWD